MNQGGQRKWPWVDLGVLILSFMAAMIAGFGAISSYVAEAQIPAATLWPLPGFVLIDWILTGSLGFISVFFFLRRPSKNKLRMTWLFSGAFIPLIILGAFSIGPMVLLSFLSSLASVTILALRNQTNWLESFGVLMIGSIGNLAIVMAIISLSGQAF